MQDARGAKFGAMRSFIFIACILAAIDQCSSLPFGSRLRTKNTAEEEQEELKIQTEQNVAASSIRGAASKVSQSKEEFAASPTVETFFQSPLESEISNSLKDTIHKMSNTKGMHDFLQTTRRSLHRKPELMYELPFTSETIRTILDELDISYTAGWAKNTHPDVYPGTGGYGIVAHIGTRDENQPCVILRADMDALPILEATEGIDPFRSTTPGKMHACGHDGHTTMLLGAAALLKKVEKEIEGTVRLVFQPAEEGGAGMKRMVEEGIVQLEPKAELAFGMHVWPT